MRSGIQVTNIASLSQLPGQLEPNSIYHVSGIGYYIVKPDGTLAIMGAIAAQDTLVAGTKAIDVGGIGLGMINATSKATVGLVTPANGALTVKFQVVVTANTVTVTALLAAGTINVADTSTVQIMIMP